MNATDDKQLPKYNLPDQIANTLKCGYCEEYLSCGPVKIKNKKYVCGRCTEEEGVEAVAVLPFEVTMSHFTFPCRYDIQGCEKRLLFNSSVQHEAKCLYRTVHCPALNCNVALSGYKLYDHFQKSHEKCLMEDEFKIELNNSADQNLLLNDSDSINIIKYRYNHKNKYLKLSVAGIIEESKQVSKYKLQIINGRDVENSINLSQKSCHKHNSSDMEIGEFDVINIENYFTMLDYPESIYIKITLFYTNEEVFGDTQINCEITYLDEINSDEEQKAREELRKNFCHQCSRLKHHSQCTTCRNRNPNIVFAQTSSTAFGHSFFNANNNVNTIPCCWQGCKEIGDNKIMPQHIKECKFKMIICPFLSTCQQGLFRFNSSFLKHLETHAECCPDPDKIIIPLYNANIQYKKDKIRNYFAVLNKTVTTITVTIKCNQDWSIRCTSSDEIKVEVYYTHSHCRLVKEEPPRNPVKDTEFTRQKANLSGCFLEFPRLNANLKIFK